MKVMGWIALAAGALVSVLVAIHPEGLNAPAWIAYLAAGAFLLAGGSMLARAYRHAALAETFACMVLGAMLSVELWVAFGPGARECVSGFGAAVGESVCRTVFGAGSVLVAGILVLAVRRWLKHRSVG